MPASATVHSSLLALCLILCAGSAFAQTLDDGLEAYNDADFRRAASLFEGLLGAGSLTRNERGIAFVHLAALQLVFEHQERAAQLARAAVAMDPEVQPPEGVGAAILGLLSEALEASGRQRLRLRLFADPPLVAGGQGHITAELEGRPEGLDTVLALRCNPAEGPAVVERGTGGSTTVDLTLPDEGEVLPCEAVAETSDDLELLRLERELEVNRRSRRNRRALGLGLGLGLGSAAVVTVAVVLAVVLSQRQVRVDDIVVQDW